MHSLRNVDLNLLVVLHALLDERHVSRTALRLNMSQPAVSHALTRLRALFADPLLVRADGGLQLTARARELQPLLAEVIRLSGSLVGQGSFDPAQAARVFRLGMSDYGALVVLPDLVRRLRVEAPGIALHVNQFSRAETVDRVASGVLDLALGVFPGAPTNLAFLPLFREDFICLADGARAPQDLSLEGYLSAAHVSVSMQGEPDGEVEQALRALGRARRIALVLPHFGPALAMLPGSDLILTVARRTAAISGAAAPLANWPPPFPIPAFDYGLLMRATAQRDPALGWLVSAIIQTMSDRSFIATAQ
jgi:DNA-binding transcriptional LysR family regulator